MTEWPEQFLDYAHRAPARPAAEGDGSARFVACWVVGHAWLLVALLLYVSMRRHGSPGPGFPTMYVLFEIGAYLSLTEYLAVQLAPILLGLACIALAFRGRRASHAEPPATNERPDDSV